MCAECNCQNGLGYRPLTIGDDLVDSEKNTDAAVYEIVSGVCDVSQGRIGTFKKLAEWLEDNFGKVPLSETTRGADLIRNADLYGACQYLLEKNNHPEIDSSVYVGQIVESGVPGGFNLANLSESWPALAVAGVALFALSNQPKKRSRSRAGSW